VTPRNVNENILNIMDSLLFEICRLYSISFEISDSTNRSKIRISLLCKHYFPTDLKFEVASLAPYI
jgi:hypothetical protein